MGERANILVIQDGGKEPPLYLYTHWDGGELPSILQAALQKRWRWEDEQYLTRILLSQMVGEDWDTETGYGLSTYLGDNGYPLLVVDASVQRVALAETPPGPANPLTNLADPCPLPHWSFGTYCAIAFPTNISGDQWEALERAS